MKVQKSYVKDTTDFINKVEKTNVGTDQIMGTLDVSSLYTNIPNKEGINCAKYFLEQNRNASENPSNESLLELLEMVLEKNNFQFNGTNFLQIGGTAMGTRVAPTYANLFMSRLEEKMLDSYPLKPTQWLRYIDDIFFIWEHGENELKKWLAYMNNYHSTIKFTAEWSKDKVNFLDTTVRVKDGERYTTLYRKPTDTNSYLRYDSAHPPKCKESLPYSQFLRLRRICKNEQDYESNLHAKKLEFKNKGYPEKILAKAEQKAGSLDRKELLNKGPKQNEKTSMENTIVLTTTYRLGSQMVPKVVKNNWDILSRSCTTKNMFRKNVLTSYKRPKNLRDFMVKAKLNYHPEKEHEIDQNKNACHKKDCIYCPLLDKTGNITQEGRQMTSKHNITCNSSNVIYCIECKKCNHRYVGQTKRKIKDRVREHLYGIKTQKDTDVSYHFNTNGHRGKRDMKVYIIDFIHAHPESRRAQILRNTIEFSWIQRLKTFAPNGMNVLDTRYT